MTQLLSKIILALRFTYSKSAELLNQVEIRRLKKLGILKMEGNSYGKINVKYWNLDTKLHIGKYVSIAEDVTFILGGNHRLDWITTFPFSEFQKWNHEQSKILGHPSSKGDIWIGNDVWIGQSATILSGVIIGNGAVVGANSVVAKDIPDYAICVGNPVRIIGFRFDPAVIARLKNLAWWNLSESEINKITSILCSKPTSDKIEFIENIQNLET
jgi:acetyltransferase-like isoleucine patch superfamily enzyme